MIDLTFLSQKARHQGAMRSRFNPYIAGAPIFDDRMLFGRETLTARVLSLLSRNSVMITGEPRIGKTSFLYHVKRALAARELGGYRTGSSTRSR